MQWSERNPESSASKGVGESVRERRKLQHCGTESYCQTRIGSMNDVNEDASEMAEASIRNIRTTKECFRNGTQAANAR